MQLSSQPPPRQLTRVHAWPCRPHVAVQPREPYQGGSTKASQGVNKPAEGQRRFANSTQNPPIAVMLTGMPSESYKPTNGEVCVATAHASPRMSWQRCLGWVFRLFFCFTGASLPFARGCGHHPHVPHRVPPSCLLLLHPPGGSLDARLLADTELTVAHPHPIVVPALVPRVSLCLRLRPQPLRAYRKKGFFNDPDVSEAGTRNAMYSTGFDVDDATSRRRQHNFGAPRHLEKTRAGRGACCRRRQAERQSRWR